MRVVAGEFKGRRLRAPRGDGTRPTSDRVREALFSALGDIGDAHVLDLFAGTGALGIEALSRGAASALFVESDRHALAALRANLEVLGLTAPRAELRAGEAIRALGDLGRQRRRYDLIFLDPPYDSVEVLAHQLAPRIAPIVQGDGRVVCESDRRMPLQIDLPVIFRRTYGSTLITIHRN